MFVKSIIQCSRSPSVVGTFQSYIHFITDMMSLSFAKLPFFSMHEFIMSH